MSKSVRENACRGCHGKGMQLFATSFGDDVEWDICPRCYGDGKEPS